MIDPNALTRDTFLVELRERIDALRIMGVDVPRGLDSALLALLGSENPFEHDAFRLSAAHLLEGLEPDIAETEGGAELLTNRLCSLPANLSLSMRVAAERHEQHV